MLRIESKLSLRQAVAKLKDDHEVDHTHAWLGGFERNEQEATFDDLHGLAALYGVTPGYFLDGPRGSLSEFSERIAQLEERLTDVQLRELVGLAEVMAGINRDDGTTPELRKAAERLRREVRARSPRKRKPADTDTDAKSS